MIKNQSEYKTFGKVLTMVVALRNSPVKPTQLSTLPMSADEYQLILGLNSAFCDAGSHPRNALHSQQDHLLWISYAGLWTKVTQLRVKYENSFGQHYLHNKNITQSNAFDAGFSNSDSLLFRIWMNFEITITVKLRIDSKTQTTAYRKSRSNTISFCEAKGLMFD